MYLLAQNVHGPRFTTPKNIAITGWLSRMGLNLGFNLYDIINEWTLKCTKKEILSA